MVALQCWLYSDSAMTGNDQKDNKLEKTDRQTEKGNCTSLKTNGIKEMEIKHNYICSNYIYT